MGNWSCLYHWFECPDALTARLVYQRLEKAGDYFSQHFARWGLRFGYVSQRLVVAGSCVKWGLDIGFSNFVCQGLKDIEVSHMGVDSYDVFEVAPRPYELDFQWNFAVCVQSPDLALSENSAAALGLQTKMIKNLPGFVPQKTGMSLDELAKLLCDKNMEEEDDPWYAVGQYTQLHGHVFFAALYGDNIWLPAAFYCALHSPCECGSYLTPIYDEPGTPMQSFAASSFDIDFSQNSPK